MATFAFLASEWRSNVNGQRQTVGCPPLWFHRQKALRDFLAIVTFFGMLCPSARAQFVGGETVYIDPISKTEELAPGIRLYLISGIYDTKKGTPDDSRVLDQDLSASTSTGDASHDRATFVLVSKNSNFPYLTILYYPWNRDGKPPESTGFLSRVITPKVTEKDGILRAKVRLNCAPTNATLTSEKDVTAAVRDAYVASEMAKVLDINADVRRQIFRAELATISSMIDPEKRMAIVDAAMAAIVKDPLLHQVQSDCAEAFTPDPKRFLEIRRRQLELWDRIRKINPLERSYDTAPK